MTVKKKGPIRWLLYIPLKNCCIDVHEDGLSSGQNIWHTCHVTNLTKIDLAYVRRNERGLLINTAGWLP